ncbi:venom acid phosphatase Acph-1 [Microplitis demolitor]|uniref:venom acid phosphatase Acph-1 n=1 Tax=Microplitis demolitor TaxID=69319 RepID=UPI0004CCC3AD|nr:venom acid phosphatase Acph-1 [Microplitis demolitor]XP_008555404.1 venom acid phosphatase Acph-1 [Microplitis demolitor]XP_008555405.1 venom acid phosphatase Acph-1 [Microplitis demolitor]
MVFKIVFLLVIINLFSKIESTKPKIEFLAVVFRHGDRAPDNGREQYPNDPYKNYEYFPEGHGGLTNLGKKREYDLGSHLRSLYNDFLGEDYTPKKLAARSTEYDRAKMSLQLVLSSLYPPKGTQVWNKYLNWQPIPYTYEPGDNDILMIPEECPQFLEELKRIKELPEVKKEVNKMRPFMQKLSLLSGKIINTTTDFYDMYHNLMAEYIMGLELPKWTQGIFPRGLLWDGIILDYKITHYNEKLRRLNGGMFIRHFTDIMSKIVNNGTDKGPKINLFSGHETNVASLLNTLGIFEPHVPAYSSGVIVELLRNETDYYVGLRYYLGIPSKSVEKQLPGCSIPCPFKDFMRIMNNLIPSDKEMICPKGESLYRVATINTEGLE